MNTDLFQFNVRNLCFVLIAITTICFPISAQTQENQTQEDKTLAPYFVVQGEPGVDQLPLKDTHGRDNLNLCAILGDCPFSSPH